MNKKSDKLPPFLSDFLHSGMAILSLILVTCICFAYSRQTIPTSNFNNGVIHQKELPIYCVESKEKNIALSFDAAWGNDDTRKILKILKKHNVHVTFFMTGGWVSSYPDDVKAIAKAGHELGNHSQNHKHMSELSEEECKEEIMSVHENVKKITGINMKVFRPPYGDYNDTLIHAVKDCGYSAIQWSVDSLDWKDYGVDSIIQTVTQHKALGNGAIILCHNGAKYTAQALDTLITALEEQGYHFVKMSDLIYTDNYEINVEGRQIPNKATPQETAKP